MYLEGKPHEHTKIHGSIQHHFRLIAEIKRMIKMANDSINASKPYRTPN